MGSPGVAEPAQAYECDSSLFKTGWAVFTAQVSWDQKQKLFTEQSGVQIFGNALLILGKSVGLLLAKVTWRIHCN